MAEALKLMAFAYAAQEAELQDLRAQVHELELQAELGRLQRAGPCRTSGRLVGPAHSAWFRLMETGTDVDFVRATSLTRFGFEELLRRFAPLYAIPPPSRAGGRPRKIRYHHQVLGILLHFYVTSGDDSTLSVVFGVAPSAIAQVVLDAEVAMAQALKGYRPARIAWPSPDRQVQLAQLVASKEPWLQRTFGFVDTTNLRVQQPSRTEIRNAVANGWLYSTFVEGTMCFSADGCIVWYRHNCPESYDDDTSAGFQERLLDRQLCPDQTYGVVTDSAFPIPSEMVGRILIPLNGIEMERVLPSRRAFARSLHDAISSSRQVADWGMESIGKVYTRLGLPLPYDPQHRRVRLENLFRLHNYRLRVMAIAHK